ncbi:hypothetical protein PROSTU_03497 [Providencia stuartii ATCC 25827]|uniref:Uncharacterized protein n=1 Tax=Providencia stuartii ATCC 25827 TaxID=471874 RepID=A0AA86YLZ4_PROST|nr:hypothetical protein PROSTU_03497 [Providencia stuartii ATCC 25827]
MQVQRFSVISIVILMRESVSHLHHRCYRFLSIMLLGLHSLYIQIEQFGTIILA